MKLRGFTLIELLVVIAIIGVLSAVVLASLNSARAKARDTQRISDLREVRKALELYYSDNGSYPPTSWSGSCSNFGSKGNTGANGWVPNLAPTYIPALPLDPKPVGTVGCYIYSSNGVDYMLLAHQTTESYIGSSNRWPRPSYTSQNSFALYTPGASGW